MTTIHDDLVELRLSIFINILKFIVTLVTFITLH